jgi:hypothetical protein
MRTIIVAGTDLFTVAAQELGDATQWYRIAALNGLTDPMVFGLTTLLVPVLDASAIGGLPSP